MPGWQLNVAPNLKHASPPTEPVLSCSTVDAAAATMPADGTPASHPTRMDANSGSLSMSTLGRASAATPGVVHGPMLSKVPAAPPPARASASQRRFADALSVSCDDVSRYSSYGLVVILTVCTSYPKVSSRARAAALKATALPRTCAHRLSSRSSSTPVVTVRTRNNGRPLPLAPP